MQGTGRSGFGLLEVADRHLIAGGENLIEQLLAAMEQRPAFAVEAGVLLPTIARIQDDMSTNFPK